jgi:EAL domain-containing protein (putative c-di-GMP-specific phosphodiesterase class I)
VLAAVAQRLREAAGGQHLLARVGGDEFAVVVATGGVEAAESVARRLLAALAAPFELGDAPLALSACAGVANLLADAHLAVYRAKQLGPGRVVRFDPELREAGRRRADLEAGLRRALERDELVLHYQPLVRLDGTLVGAEALVRWQHPERGLVPPGDFIPLAEETGLIVALGEWALHEACRQGAAWHESGCPIEIAVNVSPVQLRDEGLADAVAAALADSGLPPAALCLEITETALVHFDDDTEVLDALKALGVRLAIDDFGTGWSSLAALRRLPFDVVKLDRCFVGGIEEDAGDRAIVAAVIGLAHTLGRTIVAEGIETAGCARELQVLGADHGQGWHFGRPAPAAVFCERLLPIALAA